MRRHLLHHPSRPKTEVPVTTRRHGVDWPVHVTELHVHLGGAVPPHRLWEMALDRGIRGVSCGYEDFINALTIHEGSRCELDSYLGLYETIELIQSGPAAVRESIIAAVHRAYRSGGAVSSDGTTPAENLFSVRRIELRWNPLKRTGAAFLHGSHAGLYDLDKVIKAGINAIEEIELGFGQAMQVGQIFCFGRELTFEANLALARKARLWRERSQSIIGIDLAGNESVNPLSCPRKREEMKIVFDEAGPGLGRTVHAGETRHVDIGTFVATIEALSPSRVGQPIAAIRALWEKKDDRGVRIMKERGLVCELSVTSNLTTGVVSDILEYGRILNTLDDHGIPYTFSPDAPALQGKTLAEELLMLLNAGAATPGQIERSLQVAENSSFLPLAPHK